jgi:hypothetical protein
MSLQRMLVGAHIIETTYNYARADDPFLQTGFTAADASAATTDDPKYLYDDDFWETVLRDPTKTWRKQFVFNKVTLSEWVARIPGLGWSEEAVRLRKNAEHVERMIGGYAYDPPVKSEHVMSGVGTLRLSPGNDGSALVTLSAFGDASLGVPALMSADVFDKVQQDSSLEGRAVSGKARWIPMSETWAANFPNISKLPRGYLLLDKPDDISVIDVRRRTQIFPFTVMQYESGASELFDYVYVGASTDEGQHRKQVEAFFDKYQKDVGGHATYLFNGDMIEPLWDAKFNSPADLRRNDPGAPSQLSLLEARVRERQIGKTDLEQLLKRMGEILTESDAKVISDEIGVPYANWYVLGTTVADMCNLLVDAAMQHNRLEALTQALAIRKPQVFWGG